METEGTLSVLRAGLSTEKSLVQDKPGLETSVKSMD